MLHLVKINVEECRWYFKLSFGLFSMSNRWKFASLFRNIQSGQKQNLDTLKFSFKIAQTLDLQVGIIVQDFHIVQETCLKDEAPQIELCLSESRETPKNRKINWLALPFVKKHSFSGWKRFKTLYQKGCFRHGKSIFGQVWKTIYGQKPL